MSQKQPKQNSQTETQRVDPGNALLLLYTLGVAFILLIGLAVESHAVEPVGRVDDAQMRRGSLLLPDETGESQSAVLLKQTAHIQVSGIVARVRVNQEFLNNSSHWVDGVYTFPLPDESAVDTLVMKVGDREIHGEIREREEARAMYEQAKSEGRKSSLLAQNRPNIFTTRVANIGPGEKIMITIEYQQVVQFDDGLFSLRFPMAITPRYVPGVPVEPLEKTLAIDREGWALDTDQVPDASTITPPMATPGTKEEPTMDLTVDLVTGIPLDRVESLYHTMDMMELGEGHYHLGFTGEVVADRDFLLEWRLAEVQSPKGALFSETIGDDTYMLMMLVPPYRQVTEAAPRELIFILDVSGSMAGRSITQAKRALRKALSELRPVDRFNLISFSSTAHMLYYNAKPGTEEHIEEAKDYLDSLEADGGTEMREALNLALDGRINHERIRQIIFLTDGAVGNEEELFRIIHEDLGDSRLFTVGIGSAPNSYFMNRAAVMGRGTYTCIGEVYAVERRMNDLLKKLQTPAITDIQITATGGEKLAIESYPDPLPDLYYGEPLMVALRVNGQLDSIEVSGRQLQEQWNYDLLVHEHGQRPGIGRLWGRKKIRYLMEQLALGGDQEVGRKKIVKTALAHHLVSKYTSLVAIDTMVTRPEAERSEKKVIKSALPAGWQNSAVYGGTSQTATPSALLIVIGSLLLISAYGVHCLKRFMTGHRRGI